MDDEAKRIGANIRALREASGMTQAGVAEALTKRGIEGVHPQTVTKIESGQRAVKFVEGLSLARILGVEPRDLYEPGPWVVADAQAMRNIHQVQDAADALERAFSSLTAAQDRLRSMLTSADSPLSETVAQQARQEADRGLPRPIVEALTMSPDEREAASLERLEREMENSLARSERLEAEIASLSTKAPRKTRSRRGEHQETS